MASTGAKSRGEIESGVFIIEIIQNKMGTLDFYR